MEKPVLNSETEHLTSEEADSPSVGEVLRQARESAGLSLTDVAGRLKFSLRQLEAIEDNRFETLHGAPFVRGFVRNYARFLGVDPDPLLTKLDRKFPSAANETSAVLDEENTDANDTQATDKSHKWWFIGLLGGALIGVVSYSVFVGYLPYEEAKPLADTAPLLTTEHPVEVMPEASRPMSATLEDTSAPSALPRPVDATPDIEKAPLDDSIAEVVAKLAAASSVPQAAKLPEEVKKIAEETKRSELHEQGKIKIRTTQPAWVSITDALGKRLVYGHIEPEHEREVSGRPPFKVVVGNASHVTIHYNGETIDFTEAIHNATAKIELK